MKTKTKIITHFIENNSSASIKDIARGIKSDYRITHQAVQRLVNEQALTLTKVGNVSLCRRNPEYWGTEILIAESQRKERVLVNRNLKKLTEDVLLRLGSSHFTLLLHGDYARGRQTKYSDINLLFISPDPSFEKAVEEVLRGIPLRIEAKVVTEAGYKKLGGQGTAHTIILHGIESYYALKRP